MHILKTTALAKQQLNDIKALETVCRKHDHYALTFPIEDGSLYFLLYDEEALLSVFSAYFNGIDAWECSAFTRPAERRKGYFTDLLDLFLEENEPVEDEVEFNLVFAVDESCADTVKTLEALEAVLWYREHMMAMVLPSIKNTAAAQISNRQNPSHVTIAFDPPINRHTTSDTTFQIISKNSGSNAARPIGSFHLDFRGKTAYFYGFEIDDELRGHGLGTRSFFLLLRELSRMGSQMPETLLLQVSEDNIPAVSIYKKAGFQITETISYFIY